MHFKNEMLSQFNYFKIISDFKRQETNRRYSIVPTENFKNSDSKRNLAAFLELPTHGNRRTLGPAALSN